MTDKVQVEIKAPVATITLNKPERLNALDVEMWEGVGDACRAVDAARDVRVAVLMGAGGCFCAGLDVKAGSTLGARAPEGSSGAALAAIREHLGHLQECFTAVERLRVPVIAAIQRACMGAGMELALCCDLRVAAEGTLFSIPEVQLGIVPDMGGTQRLPRTIGIGMAKELIYSARRIDAAEALRIGLVNHVYPAGELQTRVAELAAEIAANAPLAVQAAKQAINGTYWRDRDAWLAWEAAQAAGPLLSDDRNEGMRAAAERKRANFHGR
ncbi:MAG TPA: enoyl-CoA hydratase-related protein [Methylomirabilota bacterium]|jgi:enoyl-CoA hydratase/carnithine racemase|nr:enoyl-CoA hydratase-related protein [Methylomirabilota bacterium]